MVSDSSCLINVFGFFSGWVSLVISRRLLFGEKEWFILVDILFFVMNISLFRFMFFSDCSKVNCGLLILGNCGLLGIWLSWFGRFFSKGVSI